MKRLKEAALVIGVMGGLTVIMYGAVTMTTSDASPNPSPTPTATTYVNVPIPVPGPTVTVTAKPKPQPTKTVYVTRSPQVSRGEERTAPTSVGNLWAGATEVWDGQSAAIRAHAICIVHHESWNSGTYRAENPTSTASGVAQWIDSTWLSHARSAGVKVVPHASNNPASVQDLVFIWGIKHNLSAWRFNGGNC